MNRITQSKCAAIGYKYAGPEKRADTAGNNQPHDLAFKIVGPIDARKGFDLCLADIQRDLAMCESKLRWDSCIGDCKKGVVWTPRKDMEDFPCCTCGNVTLNQPIIFDAIFYGQGHTLHGQQCFGVLLTGTQKAKRKRIITSR